MSGNGLGSTSQHVGIRAKNGYFTNVKSSIAEFDYISNFQIATLQEEVLKLKNIVYTEFSGGDASGSVQLTNHFKNQIY